MLVNQQPPDRNKPCWVLIGKGQYFGRLNIILREYEWSKISNCWQPTGTEERPTSIYRALAKASWVGALPGSKRRSQLNQDTKAIILEGLAAGRSLNVIATASGASRGTVYRARKKFNEWQRHQRQMERMSQELG